MSDMRNGDSVCFSAGALKMDFQGAAAASAPEISSSWR